MSSTCPTYVVSICLRSRECPYTLFFRSGTTISVQSYVPGIYLCRIQYQLVRSPYTSFFSAATDTCQPIPPHKVKTLSKSTDCLPTEFSVPINTYPLNWMDGDGPYSPPLLSAPTQRPEPLGPPEYSGSTPNINTAPTAPHPTRHNSCLRPQFGLYVTTWLYHHGLRILPTANSLSWWHISSKVAVFPPAFHPIVSQSHTTITCLTSI